MVVFVVLVAGALFVAYSNGANDNFKGVATLYGSGMLGYRKALAWATAATLAGSIASVFLAATLVGAFSGKGLVPDDVAARPAFLAAVALGAALTVFIATRFGLPISTTHALTGGLVGAGITAAGAVNFGLLGSRFFLPLVASPLLALALGILAYAGIRLLPAGETMCICVDTVRRVELSSAGSALVSTQGVSVRLDSATQCAVHSRGEIFGVAIPSFLDAAHFVSAGAVSFARGLNDTPKIVGLMVALDWLDVRVSLLGIAIAMAGGGLMHARRVAETMSHRITRMDRREGLSSNLVTSLIVLTASWSGFPVSTTHVSCGALFGLGLVSGQADLGVVRQIVFSWVLTLPLAMFLASLAALLIAR